MPFYIVKDKEEKERFRICSKKGRKYDKCHSTYPMNLGKTLAQFKILNDSYLSSDELPKKHFINWLKSNDINPNEYLKQVRNNASKNGYDKRRLHFSDKPSHKLMYIEPEDQTKKYFGLTGYGDIFIYQFFEKQGKVPKGTADMKTNVFQKSHGAIGEMKELDKYAPNSLALRINW